jgi:hypothetical protein
LASYFASLRLALKAVQDNDPNAIALNVGQYIPPLKDDPQAQSIDQIKAHLEGYSRFEQPNDLQLQLLAEVVRQATTNYQPETNSEGLSESTLPAPVDLSKPKPDSPEIEAVEIPEATSPAENVEGTPDIINPSAVETPAPEPVAAPRINFDPNDFNGFSGLHVGNAVITVESIASGAQKVSWLANPSKIYVVSASKDAPAASPAMPNFKVITAGSSCELPERFRFVTVFEFDEPKTRGRLFGSTETLGSVWGFELDAFATQVRMRWQTDDPSAEVRIAKSLNNQDLPSEIAPSFLIYQGLAADTDTFVDEAVQSGEKFQYRIWLERVNAGRVSKSESISEYVNIPGAIPKIQDFSVRVSELGPNFVDITFRQLDMPNAEVLIYQVQDVPSNRLMGAIASCEIQPIPLEILKSPDTETYLGKQIIARPPTVSEGLVTYESVPLPTEETGSRTFTSVVTLGGFARIGEISVIDQIGDVSEAELTDRLDYQIVRVAVPEGADFIEVWQTNPSQTWDGIKHTAPNRSVNIATEYRPNGGVLFTKPNPTLPDAVDDLGVDPAKLFIRGASIFKGERHGSPNAFELHYPGRIEVHVKIDQLAAQPPARTRGWFGGNQNQVAPAGNLILFKVVAPASITSDISLHHLQAPAQNGLPVSLRGAIGQIHLNPSRHREWAPYFPSDDGISGPPLTAPAGTLVRFVPVFKEFADIPIFVVDEKINAEKARLPKATPSKETYKVILVGAKRSGKTTYVQALLNYLENQFAPRFGAVMIPNNVTPAAKYRLDELHKFLKDNKLPLGTPSAKSFDAGPPTKPNDPRIAIKFDFIGDQSPFSSLELFDVAGEDMDAGAADLYAEQLAAADLVIYLFDPLQLTGVSDALGGVIGMPEQGSNPLTVLLNLAQVLNAAPNRNPKQKVAIAISKFDGLVQASNLQTGGHDFHDTIKLGMSITRDPNAWDSKKFNEIDGWQVHQEVRGLLQLVPALNPFIQLAKENFGPQTRFFAVSSLGHATFSEYMSRAGITSYRVGDPIMWLANNSSPAAG